MTLVDYSQFIDYCLELFITGFSFGFLVRVFNRAFSSSISR